MGMFTTYQNISNNFIPNNMRYQNNVPTSYTKLAPNQASKPYECYNAQGDLEGYCWYYGDGLNLEFNIDGEITVESNAIIYKSAGLEPNGKTVGAIGQRAYNITDLRSWTCSYFIDNTYVWVEDAEFTYPLGEDKSVYLSAEKYLEDKTLIFCLYNFRMEEIYRETFSGTPSVIIPITPELSKTLVKGIYYCSLTAVSAKTSETIFDARDCKILVK